MMMKLSQFFYRNTRNVLLLEIQSSFPTKILLRSKASETVRNSNPKHFSSIAITKSNYSTGFNSFHNVTISNKSTDSKNHSSILLVNKKGQFYSFTTLLIFYNIIVSQFNQSLFRCVISRDGKHYL